MGPYPLFAPDAPPTIPATKMYAYNAAGAIQYEGWAASSINPQPSQPVWAIKDVHVRRQRQADDGAMGCRFVRADERLEQRCHAHLPVVVTSPSQVAA
jgi:hypothetical protein